MAAKIFSRSRPVFAFVRPGRREVGSVPIKPELESLFNVQINAELHAWYTYLAMANYFGRQSVALPGHAAFYLDQVKEELGHAQKLIDFVNARGGRVSLSPVPQPSQQEWDPPASSLAHALHLELDISQKLLILHEECHSCSDLFACNLIESEFLDEQMESVDKIARFIAQSQRMGCDGLAVHLFDQYLLSQTKK